MPITGDRYAFTDKNVSQAPDSAGVYALYRDGTLTYIGRARGNTTSIRSRLKDHKAGRDGQCTQASSHYKREATASAAAREKQLLDEYYRQHGRLPLCNDIRP